MDRDRNLLFGVLAVQLRRVTSAQLVEAAALWLAEPSRPLADRLIQLGALTPDDLTFLDAIVENTLHLHNDDAHQAYSSLAGHETWKDAVSRAPDSEAMRSISTMLGLPLHIVELTPGSISAVDETPGRYSRTSEYARGGMGRILLVHDQYLDRDIALKELLPFEPADEDLETRPPDSPLRASAQLVGRFLREARVTGQLEHPSIVPVYELGRRPNGTLYYTMKLVRGQTLGRAIRDAQSLRERLALLSHVVDLCQALAYAHSRNVIHRDIKPSNVMIGGFGETVVIDWGLAKIVGQEDIYQENLQSTWSKLAGADDLAPPQTDPGAALGTPHYMSPEQASGSIDTIDERSDVYALGAVLYELLSGRAPFLGRTTQEILHEVVHNGPRPVQEAVPDAPLELVQICAKAMAMQPERRYQSAKELSDDLIRFQTGALVRSYAYSPRELIIHYYRRHRAVWNTAAAGLAAFLIVAVVSYINILNARNRERAQRIEAEEVGYLAHVRLAQTLVDARNFDAANEILAATQPERRGWEWEYLQRQANRDRFTIPDAGVAQFTPDGHFVIAAPRDRAPILYDATTGERLREFVAPPYLGRLLSIDVSPAGDRCVTTTAGRDVVLWSIPDGTVHSILSDHAGLVQSAEYSADGRIVVTAADDGIARLWNAETGQLIAARRVNGAGLWRAMLAGDDMLVCAGKDERTYTTGTGEDDPVRSVPGQLSGLSQDRRHYIVVTSEAAETYSIAESDPLRQFTAETGFIQSARISPDASHVAIIEQDRMVRVIDGNTGVTKTTLQADGILVDLAFAPKGDRLMGWRNDGRVFLWDIQSESLIDSWHTHTDDLVTVACDNTGEAMLTIAVGKETRIWPMPSVSTAGFVARHQARVRVLAANEDATRLASAAADGAIQVYDTATNQPLAAIAAFSSMGTDAVDLSSDGTRLITAIDEHSILLWDLKTDAPLTTIFPDQGRVYDVEFGPGDTTIASAGWDGTAKVWNTADGQLVSVFDGHADSIRQLAISPDGATLATVSDDHTAALWDLATGKKRHAFDARHGALYSVAFTADGTRCVVGADDGAAVVWSVETGASIATLSGHARAVVDVAFTPRGDRIFTVAWDGLRVWDARRYAELTHVQPLQGHEFADASFHDPTGAMYVGALDGSVHRWKTKPTPELHEEQALPLPFHAIVTAQELETRLRRLREVVGIDGAADMTPRGMTIAEGPIADTVATLCLRAGDCITSIESVNIQSVNDINRALEAVLARVLAPNDVVSLQFQRAGRMYDARLVCLPVLHEEHTRTISRDDFEAFVHGELQSLRKEADIVQEVQERRMRQRGDQSPAGYWMLSAASPEQRRYYRAMGLAPGDHIQQFNGGQIHSVLDMKAALVALESDAERDAVSSIQCMFRRGSLARVRLTLRME